MIVEEITENHDFDYNDIFVVENILKKIEKFRRNHCGSEM